MGLIVALIVAVAVLAFLVWLKPDRREDLARIRAIAQHRKSRR